MYTITDKKEWDCEYHHRIAIMFYGTGISDYDARQLAWHDTVRVFGERPKNERNAMPQDIELPE